MCREKAKTILLKDKLRVSKARIELLAYFFDHPGLNDLGTIQRYFLNVFNRITIYRTLNYFVEQGFLTKIHSANGKACYVFHHSPVAIHPHFRCNCCGAIHCFPELPEDYFKQLKPFKIETMSFLFEGVCENCVNKQPNNNREK